MHRILIFATLYVLAWIAVPPLLGQSFALDVVESLSWGQEWQWGYYKHPPLAPVVLNIFYVTLGKFGPYVLSQLCIALTLVMVWRTGRRLMDADRAFLGTVLTMGVAYYNFPAIEFNHNIAQMPLWAALGYGFVAALQDGKLRQWLGLGLLAGLGMLTKYSIAVLLLTFGLFVLVRADQRKLLLRLGPWLAVGTMLLVLVPHLLWLQASEGLPFAYASARAAALASNPRAEALMFPITQLAAHLPLLAVLTWAWWRTHTLTKAQPAAAGPRLHTHNPALLLWLALVPGVIVVLLGVTLGMRLRDMWGSPMWAFSGLLVVACVPAQRLAWMRPSLLRALAVWLVLVTAFMTVYMGWGAQLRGRPARVDWPALTLAQQADRTWQQLSTCPLDTVAGDYWLTGLVSAFGASRPSVLIDGDARFSPWVDTQRLQTRGALWFWQAKPGATAPQPPEPLASLALDDLQVQEGSWQIAWPHAIADAPLQLRWRAYIPLACRR